MVTLRQSGPDILTIAIAALPGAVESAYILELLLLKVRNARCLTFNRNKGRHLEAGNIKQVDLRQLPVFAPRCKPEKWRISIGGVHSKERHGFTRRDQLCIASGNARLLVINA